jgi:hypothetical protein
MGTRPRPEMLDDRGAIRADAWAAWIKGLRAAGWTVQRIADELGCKHTRHVRAWQSGQRKASYAVRRLAWRALWAPLEAEAGLGASVAPRPLQATTRDPATTTPMPAREALLARLKAGRKAR